MVAATVAVVPFLLAVALVVARPSRRVVAGGAALVYAVDLLWTVVGAVASGVPGRIGVAALVVPLPRVVAVLAVATAVWLAYHGGYDRLVAAAGDAPRHPLVAVLADERIGPALPLRRGVVVASLAGVVGAGGLVAAGGIGTLLEAVARPGATGSSVVVGARWQVRGVGIPPARLPVRWLFEASFLLGVLFVTGPRLRPRDLPKGIAVVFGVQSTVKLLPTVVPPFEPVYLLDASGPVLGPLGDAITLAGVAGAVWLAGRGGPETLRDLARSRSLAE